VTAKPDRSHDPAPARCAALRVLIADDYPDSAETMAVLLSLAGFDTRIATDGEDALSKASAWRPHVCVLDLGMPKLDGYELARRLRDLSWGECCLLIAHTGWTAISDRREASDAGFDCYINKPTDPAELVRVIRNSGQLTRAAH
jgi:DNA-binding response OmpR family regulator